MAIKIALILSIILQFGAAIIAISLIKRTKANIAWWLISLGFLLMAIRRVFETLLVYNPENQFASQMLNSWTGVLISFIMLFSLIFIKRIFNIQKQMDILSKQNESKVLSAIIRTEEKERQRFAKDLHDGLGPLLSSVKMAISARNQTENNEVILANAENLIDESIITLKEVSNNLSPHILNNLGLFKAIKSFIAKLQLHEGPDIKLNCNIEHLRFSYNIEVVVYRILCELINNTLKHAQAYNIYIDLLSDDNMITLEYIDDGLGIDDLTNKKSKGMGLSNIESRIKSLYGSYNFYSKPGEGVRVNIQINLD